VFISGRRDSDFLAAGYEGVPLQAVEHSASADQWNAERRAFSRVYEIFAFAERIFEVLTGGRKFPA
jgi:hypothetical protein